MNMSRPWRKSSRSQGNGGNCVEARPSADGFQVRDSKLDEQSPIFDLARSEFESLLRAAR